MTDNTVSGKRFRVTLFRVMSVQVVTLLLLWWMQSWFSR
jgi:hypothetical protein